MDFTFSEPVTRKNQNKYVSPVSTNSQPVLVLHMKCIKSVRADGMGQSAMPCQASHFTSIVRDATEVTHLTQFPVQQWF